MKVLFLQDVPNVAKAGEIKDVSTGYAKNFLLPRKLATKADAQANQIIEAQRRMETRTQAEIDRLAQQLAGQEITLKAQAGASERLFGSITSADIAAELQAVSGLVIDKRKIELAEPIRQLGEYEVTIRLAKDSVPKIKVTVAAKETT